MNAAASIAARLAGIARTRGVIRKSEVCWVGLPSLAFALALIAGRIVMRKKQRRKLLRAPV